MNPHGGGAWTLMRRRDMDDDHKLPPGTIPRALRMAAHFRGAVAGFLLITVFSAILAAAPPQLLRVLIDDAILEGDRSLVGWVALAGVIVAVSIALAGLVSRFLSSRIGEGLIYDMRVALFDHVQRMPIAFFTRTQTGSLISRLNNDVVGAQNAMTQTLGSVVDNVIRLATVLVLMFATEWRITLIALVLLPGFLIPGKRIGRRLQNLQRDRMDLNAGMNARMQERFNVSGAMLSKLFGDPGVETEEFAARAGEVRDSGVTIAVYARVLFVMLAFVAAVGSAVVYWLGGRWAIAPPGVEPSLSVGEITALVAYVGMLYGPLTMLTNARVDLMTAFVSFERVFEVLDLPPMITDAPDAVPLPQPVRGTIEFRDVRFRYPRASEVSLASLESVARPDARGDGGEVLRGVSFTAEAGSTVALVGPSGAGKTTISNLIPRLYDVTGGAVLVDDHDVRTVTQESLRAAIGTVAQDPHLFHDTVAANLRFAKPGATDEELVAACEAAQIHHVIAALPDGYDTMVGERGYRFSGGEKQRVAIARVLLKAPPIIILDEATSHLDGENEALIQRALGVALEGRTSIVIAHRLSTIVAADQILVIEGGRIAQSGTHKQLVRARGTYADLYATQFAESGP